MRAVTTDHLTDSNARHLSHQSPEAPLRYVTIKADLGVAIGESPVRRVDLVKTLDAAGEGQNRRILLRADRSVPYGEMMNVLEILRTGGYSKIKLVALETAADPAGPPQPAKP